jgi:hypothetical protein
MCITAHEDSPSVAMLLAGARSLPSEDRCPTLVEIVELGSTADES